MKKSKIWILCGGKSAERDVSLVSAKFIYETMDRAKFTPELIHIDPAGHWRKAAREILAARVAEASSQKPFTGPVLNVLKELGEGNARPDVIFPVLHGTHGEDGTLQGLLELCSAAYVGCGVLASAAGMDKEVSKRLALQAGIPILPYRVAHGQDQARAAAKILGFPLFVKPARQGSAIGVSRVAGPSALAAAVREALLYDDKILLEKASAAREIECGVLGDPTLPKSHPLGLKASICGEVAPNAEFYTYAAKYIDPNGAARFIPAPISTAQERRIQDLSLAMFRAIDGHAMARVDFFLDKKSGKIYFNEINTIPGFTSISMYPALWSASGLSPKLLIERLIRLALRRGQAKARILLAPPKS